MRRFEGCSKMRLFVAVISVVISSSLLGEEDFRSWISSDGQRIQGKLIDFGEKLNQETQEMVPYATLDMKIPAGNEKKGEVEEIRRFEIPMDRFAPESQSYILDWDWGRNRAPFLARCLQVVMGEVRDLQKQRIQETPIYDRIYLKDGAVAKGIVKNANVALHASYGAFALNVGRIAAVQFAEEGESMDQLLTVNTNRFSGFISFPEDATSGGRANYLTYTSDTGQTETIRKEMIGKIIFQVREDELSAIDARRMAGGKSVFVRLKNGDYFDAKVGDGQFSINATGRTVNIAATDVNRIEVAGKNRAQTVVLKNNGGKEIGYFADEDLPIKLDIGPELSIYRERLDLVYCVDSFRPLGTIVNVAEEKDARLTINQDPGGNPVGIVSRIGSSSAFMGVLEPEDKIVSINQQIPDFESKDTTYELALEAMFEEQTMPYIVMGVQRGGQFFQVTIINAPASG